MKTYEQMAAPVEYTFLVVDDEFNRANYPDVIGKIFAVPLGYAHCKQNKSLTQLMKEGIVREYRGEYLGRTDNGVEVSLGNVFQLELLTAYLAEFGPSDW